MIMNNDDWGCEYDLSQKKKKGCEYDICQNKIKCHPS